jgi:hypothetical protein
MKTTKNTIAKEFIERLTVFLSVFDFNNRPLVEIACRTIQECFLHWGLPDCGKARVLVSLCTSKHHRVKYYIHSSVHHHTLLRVVGVNRIFKSPVFHMNKPFGNIFFQ